MEMQTTTGREREGSTLARGLGWFSLGLGLAEVAAPRLLAGAIGAPVTPAAKNTLRAFGAREIAAGVAILQWPERPRRVWSRVFGDAIDLAALAWAMRGKRSNRERLIGAMFAVAGVAALDVIAARRVSRAHASRRVPCMSITINREAAEVYAYWTALDEWNLSNVTFAQSPDGYGTVVRVELPAGKLQKLFGKVPTMKDLREMKQILETGEVVRSDASIHRLPHPAHPSKGEL
jgi:hypothetical protein